MAYKKIHRPEHPKAGRKGSVYEHVLIAEKALGRFLPAGACVHHVDVDTKNNANANLVICQDHAYHKLLHARAAWRRAGLNLDTQRLSHGRVVSIDYATRPYRNDPSVACERCRVVFKTYDKTRKFCTVACYRGADGPRRNGQNRGARFRAAEKAKG